jgi:hypothetical protein
VDTATLEKLEELHMFFRHYRSNNGAGFWFRGQANSEWPLIPKAGRKEYFLSDNGDLGRHHNWKEQAVAYQELSESLIESLALAQHHGLATRLLDWTQNPLVATFFAVSSEPNSDGAIYIMEPLDTFILNEVTRDELTAFDEVVCYFPRAISPRLLNQQGMFTVHSPSDKKIAVTASRRSKKRTNIKKIIIPCDMKKDLEEMISDYGINSSMIFPDLDGLSAHKNKETAKLVQHKKT